MGSKTEHKNELNEQTIKEEGDVGKKTLKAKKQ